MPAELERQWLDAPAFFAAFGWRSEVVAELEADDVLGSLAQLEVAAGGDVLLFTGDRDMFQCVGDHVTVLFPRGGKDGPEVVDAAGVRERYGIEPEQVPDFIALRGDPSDGLPGARGIGAKTARDLLRAHGTLEGVIAAAARPGAMTPRQAGALTADPGALRAFKDIATLRHVELRRPADAPLDRAGAAAAARERGMNRLAERLEDPSTA
jgi:DNA polymerase-1